MRLQRRDHSSSRAAPELALYTGAMERRRVYISLHDEGVRPEHVEGVFHRFLDLRRPQLTKAVVDAISDDKHPPSDVEEARRKLIDLGRNRPGRGDPQMAIELDLTNSEHFALLRTFGLYSIYALVYEEGQDIEDQLDRAMGVDDSGYSIDVLVHDAELRQLADDAGLPVESFKEAFSARPPSPPVRAARLLVALVIIWLIAWMVWKVVT